MTTLVQVSVHGKGGYVITYKDFKPFMVYGHYALISRFIKSVLADKNVEYITLKKYQR